ncbi:hypothetical protein [Rubripirellula reticaptiva]|uniref:Uncharacterized protein n=1 Tax=Rubripirellula reticaptiva TaxID=2528013 RepID=A0A5C6EQE8_9BACT|nr:hypothetical protein [Rubripirellula reticaptiva]TWU52003.1 hypothetical protein Poly59_36000 [Rubripirellula reticaptiva]
MPTAIKLLTAYRVAHHVFLILAAIAIFDARFVLAQQDGRPRTHPSEIEFRRQAVRRMVFDSGQTIPLSTLDPSKVVSFDLMHPELLQTKVKAKCSIDEGALTVASADEVAESVRWFGGFNPFATYEVTIGSFAGTGSSGLSFQDFENANSLSAEVMFADGMPVELTWRIVHDSIEVDQMRWEWPAEIDDFSKPFVLRVQMSAVGVNVFVESEGRSHLVGYADFSKHFDLRKQSRFTRFHSGISSRLQPQSHVKILAAAGVLSPGSGQADLRAITDEQGVPLIEDGRLWLTITLRGRALPHPTQGVFSMNPSVFDLRFEGVIVFDMGDGLLRNELASHIFRDSQSGQWCGWTTGFSAFGNDADKEAKTILAVWSSTDPRRGFSVMKAKPVGIEGAHEDPHCIYDSEAKKWRLLLCEHGKKYQAAMWESDHWDHGFQRLAGPVDVDSTGTLIQKFGDIRYALFGSADRKIYVRSYPDLQPVGELKMDLPPWNDDHGTRVWPNVIPMPDGYPAPFIALMMDRANFPGMPKPNWTYGAIYLYHGYPIHYDD